MLASIDANAQAITALQNIVKDGGTLEIRVDDLESRASAVEGRATTLENIVDGYGDEGDDYATVKAHVAAVSVRAEEGITDAATAQEAAEAAQADVDDLAEVVNDAKTGLAATKSIADGAASEASRLAAIVDTGDNANSKLRSDITTLQGIVSTGNDSNAKLREAITDLQGIVKTGADANATLRTDLKTLQDVVNHATTGLAATKVIADRADAKSIDNARRIKAIEDDYLKQADEFIFNCGTSTTVVHEKAAQ
jgi:chromosome segregation ATPase